MRALHKPDTIFSLRHVPSWLLLTGAAGTVNVVAFLATQRFVTHLTGTATRLGITVASSWVALDFAIVLACFVLGAIAASLVIDVRAERGKQPLYALPLFVTAALLALAAALGQSGVFGPFGGSVDQPADFVLLSILSFAMGLQNGAVATSTGLVVRTTHLTGPATDLGLHLAELTVAEGARRHVVLRSVALRAGKIAAFIAGAAVAVPLTRWLGYAALLIPAAQVALANALSFAETPRVARATAAT